MKATELRIGNYVTFTDEIKTIATISPADFAREFHKGYHFDGYEPIPLTDEWLVKFWFEPNEMERFGIGDGSKEIRIGGGNSVLIICVKSKWCAVMDDDFESCTIKFPDNVHQLQNLYFALTGEELTTI